MLVIAHTDHPTVAPCLTADPILVEASVCFEYANIEWVPQLQGSVATRSQRSGQRETAPSISFAAGACGSHALSPCVRPALQLMATSKPEDRQSLLAATDDSHADAADPEVDVYDFWHAKWLSFAPCFISLTHEPPGSSWGL